MIYAQDGYHRLRAPRATLEDVQACLWSPEAQDEDIPDEAWVPLCEAYFMAAVDDDLVDALAAVAREHIDAVKELGGGR